MKKSYFNNSLILAYIIIVIIAMLSFNNNLKAQVKIGDNPNTIDLNSMLEIESANKGFLPPRIILNDVNTVAPLTAPVTPGMLVYSSGGTVSDGYYYWNGTKWQAINTSSSRTNYVLVKSAADFPTAVAGVITLDPNILYEINGSISISNKINLNNSMIIGEDWKNDKLIYTGTAELFTGAEGGKINSITLTAASAGSKLFNLDGGGGEKDIIIYECFIIGCNDIGIIKNYDGMVTFQTMIMAYNTNGITLENIDDFYEINTFWESNNSNTFEKLVGAFSEIAMTGGDRGCSSANSAIVLDVTGITSITKGACLKAVLFTGDGTYVQGSFSSKWDIESYGLNTEKDDIASGNLYISSTANTVIASANTPVKILGTTTSVNLFRFTSPTNNRLTYTGVKTRRSMVICSLTSTFLGSSGNKYFSFYIAKNGVVLPESKQKVKLLSNTDQGPISISCLVSLAPNDYIEVWVANNTDGTDMLIQTLNMSIK